MRSEMRLGIIKAGNVWVSLFWHDSQHITIQQRIHSARTNPAQLMQPLKPLAGLMLGTLALTVWEYTELVDWTGRQMRPNKHAIAKSTPSALKHLGYSHQHWTVQVKAIGSGYFRVIGSVQQMQEKAQHMNQRWLQGIGLARKLEQV